MKAAHLTPAQRGHLRQALETKRAELRAAIERYDSEASQGPVESAELEDVAEGVIEDRTRVAIEERDRRLLEEVDHALAKMEAGEYGLSEVSGKPIPLERLKVVPWTRYAEDEAEHLERSPR